MSSEAKKNCRTQGKYSDRNQFVDKKTRKSLEKRLKDSPTEKETQEKKFLKRKSNGTKEGASFGSENNESAIEYQENSAYSFSQLEERKKPIEITKHGKFVLSNTENGESSVLYEPNFFTKEEAFQLFELLHENTKWLDKNIIIHGVEYPQPRLVAWYGPLPYSYSGTTLEAAEMPDCVLGIKRRIEDYLKGQNIDVELNSVLLNLYRNNKDSVSWHSDDELTMGVCPTIASISLGETRKFEMRPKVNKYSEDEHKIKEEYFVHLNNGSLIIMDGCMQEDWQHRVPKEYHDRDARINLTFRTVYAFEKGSPYSDLRVNNHKHVDLVIPKNPSRIHLDEENFPPLSSVSNNINSKSTHKSFEKTESVSEMNNQISSSEEEWLLDDPSSNKTTSRINVKIKAIEKEGVVIETPVGIEALTETNHKTFRKRDDVQEYTEKHSKENSEFSEVNKLNYNDCEESAFNSHPTPPESNTKSHKDWYGKSQILSESDKTNQLPEEKWEKSFDYQKQIPLESDTSYQSRDGHFEKDHKQSASESNTDNQPNEDYFDERDHSKRTPSKSNKHYQSHDAYFDKKYHHPRQTSSESNKNYRYNENYFNERNNLGQTPSEFSKNSRSNEAYFGERDHHRQPPSKYNKHYKSNEDRLDKRNHPRQTSSEFNKNYRSNENHFDGREHHRQTPSEFNKNYRSNENRKVKSNARPNQYHFDKADEYHEERGARPYNKMNAQSEKNRYPTNNVREYTGHFYKNRLEKDFKSDEVKSFESHNVERNTLSNENIDGNEQKFDKNQNFKTGRNESSNFVMHSTPGHFFDVRNEPVLRSNQWKPNLGAKEFVPGKMNKPPSEVKELPSSVESSKIGHFSLNDLLNREVDLMPSDDLKNYANALRSTVLDEISAFESRDKEELETLCKITDGNQTDRNQKIICSRICALVNKTMPDQRNPEINPPVSRYQP